MRLTVHTDYALRTLIYLAVQEKELVSTEEVSKAYDISSHHLRKVVQQLVRLGYVKSIRGRTGGIALAQSPEQVNIGKVIRQVEPDNSLLECFDSETNTCPISPVCVLKDMLQDAEEAFLNVLDQYTLQEIIENRRAYASILNISISA